MLLDNNAPFVAEERILRNVVFHFISPCIFALFIYKNILNS